MRRGRRGIGRQDTELLKQVDDGGDMEVGSSQKGASVWRLLALAKEEIWVLALACVFLVIASSATVTIPKLIGEMTDVASRAAHATPAQQQQAFEQLNRLVLFLVLVLSVGAVAGGIRAWLFESASVRVMCRLRQRVFASVCWQEIGFYDRVRIGELTNRLGEDTRLMKNAGTISISMLLRSTAVALGGMVLMVVTSPRLSALTVLVLPVLLVGFHLFAITNKKYTVAQLNASAEASTVAEETFGCIRTVRAFAQEDAACRRYDQAVLTTQRWGVAAAQLSGFFGVFSFLVGTGAVVVILWYGARLVVYGVMTPGDLSAFVLYVVFVGSSVGGIAGTLSQLVQAVGASQRVFQLLDRPPAMDWSGTIQPMGAPEGADVRFVNVWFAYPSRPQLPVLQDLCLHVAPGKHVALVGTSGGGKSTIVSMMERFYDPTRGTVLLDDTPLPHIDHRFLHTQVALVSQEPLLFADTLRFNICFGVPGGVAGVTQEDIESAARQANAHDFIMQFPEGYDSLVGERGVRLSGGQKQRIAIARALMLKPRLLLLDEATSALDAESEALVQEALERAVVGRTVVMIAHRLSTVIGADEVLVVDEGRVVEQGTHTQLVAQGGVYARLVQRQLLGGSHRGSEVCVDGAASTADVHEQV